MSRITNTKYANIPMETIIGSNYIKYNRLSEIVQKAYHGSSADKLNIFIDINSMIRGLFNKNTKVMITDEYELAAHIINICGHYRKYFKGLQVQTRFFLIWGLNIPKQNKLFARKYNTAFEKSITNSKTIFDNIRSNMRVLELLSPYLPDIYYLNADDNETSAFIEFFYKTYTKYLLEGETLVLSRDILSLQLIPSISVKILRPRKISGVDESFIIDHKNFWKSFITMRNYSPLVNEIPINCFSNILAMTRLPERSMSSIKSFPHVYRIFDNVYRLGYIKDSIIYDQQSLDTIFDSLQIHYDYYECQCRWKAISSTYHANNILGTNPIYEDIKLPSVDNSKSLVSACDQIFGSTLINFDYL